jgi:hypothetical protein
MMPKKSEIDKIWLKEIFGNDEKIIKDFYKKLKDNMFWLLEKSDY